MSSRQFFFFIGLALAALSLWLDLGCFPSFAQQWRARSFIATPATVISSRVDFEITYNKNGNPHYSHRAEVVYSYQRDATAYQSNTVRFFSTGTGATEAAEIVARFPAQQATVAYVDPADPANSVLLQEWMPSDATMLLILAGLHALAFASLLASRPWKHGRPVFQQGHREVMLVNYSNPFAAAAGSLGCLGLPLGVLQMLFAFFYGWKFFALSCALTLALAVSMARDSFRNNRDLKRALVLDPRARTLTYKDRVWSWNEIRFVLVEASILAESKCSWLALKFEDNTTYRIVSDPDAGDVRLMAYWLREKLGLKDELPA